MAQVTGNHRLLFVAPSAYPLGGVATWLDYLLPGLEEQGWEPTLGLVAGVHHNPNCYLAAHPFHRTVSIYNPTGSQEGRIRALCKTIADIAPAIVLSVNIPDLFLAQARLRSSGHGRAKTVMTLHGIQADLLVDAHTFRNVLDAVICTNALTCELVRGAAGVPEGRIHYAHYGVELKADARLRPRRPRRREPIRIAWVGRLEQEQKRVGDLPAILEALEDRELSFELWVVGGGPEEYRLRRELGRWLEDGRAKLLGELPRERVCAEIYPQADCLLLTSSWETGPLVVWEAMAAGLPVVTSEYVGSGPEGSLVHGENCLMFAVGNVQSAARRIGDLCEYPRRAQLAAAGLELVQSRYSRDASVIAWNHALHEALASANQSLRFEMYSVQPRGRLDSLLGVRLGETLRRYLGVSYAHSSAGGEWPHSISAPVPGSPE